MSQRAYHYRTRRCVQLQGNEVSAKVLNYLDTKLAVEVTRDLVRIPSVVGDEKPIAEYLAKKLSSLGFKNVEMPEVFPGRPNVVAWFDGPKPGTVFAFNGHLDTKPVCEGWDEDPFSGDIRNGRLYGHGVMDMKAGLGAQVAAAHALKEAGIPAGRIYFSAVCDHMGDQGGAKHFFAHNKVDRCILGELTDLKVCVAHRGRYYFDVTAIGKAAHTCHREKAINAIAKMAPLVTRLEALRYVPTSVSSRIKELVGEELIMAVGRIYGGLPPGGPSMIPDKCTIRVDTRPQPGVSVEEVRAVLEKAIEKAKAEDPQLKVEMVLTDVRDYFSVPEDAVVVKAIRRAVEVVTGGPAEVIGTSWLGDTSSFGRQVETVIYGPGHDPVYMPNEFLPLSDIETAAKVYALAALWALE